MEFSFLTELILVLVAVAQLCVEKDVSYAWAQADASCCREPELKEGQKSVQWDPSNGEEATGWLAGPLYEQKSAWCFIYDLIIQSCLILIPLVY